MCCSALCREQKCVPVHGLVQTRRTKGTVMIDHDNLEDFRDADLYDLRDEGYDDDYPLTEQWARATGGPLLDLACGTGRMALRLAGLGYQVTGVDITPEMIAQARQKASQQARSIDWVVADARTFQLGKQFSLIYMLENAWQFFLTRAGQEALLARVREHLLPEGCFLFETRNLTPRNVQYPRRLEPQKYQTPNGGQLVVADQQYYDPMTQIQHYTNTFTFFGPDGRELREQLVRVALRYVYPQEIEALLHYNGFEIRTCYGSWQQEPLIATSPAMIYVCQRRV